MENIGDVRSLEKQTQIPMNDTGLQREFLQNRLTSEDQDLACQPKKTKETRLGLMDLTRHLFKKGCDIIWI